MQCHAAQTLSERRGQQGTRYEANLNPDLFGLLLLTISLPYVLTSIDPLVERP